MTKKDGSKYLGNTRSSSMEVHNLENEKNGCQIDEIINYKHFVPDTLAQAHSESFDNCAYCIGDSKR